MKSSSDTGSLKRGLLIREAHNGTIYLITKYVQIGDKLVAVRKHDITKEFEALEIYRWNRREKDNVAAIRGIFKKKKKKRK